ncbi:proline/alanine-rich repeat-containing protein [Calothrix sp. NIES-4101]|nr:proline/alanine-rich repeat-containing protein [Calothrix sp. NIES-4101]
MKTVIFGWLNQNIDKKHFRKQRKLTIMINRNTRNLLTALTASLLIGTLGVAVATEAIALPNLNLIAQNSPQKRPHHRRPDFAAAAKQLGVSEAELIKALGLPEKPPTDVNGRPSGPPPKPDFAAAAKKLGVTEEQLIKVLGIPPHRRPDFAAAAKQLGVSEKDLIAALGVPEKPPTDANGRPSGPPPKSDFATAAKKLGVTEELLIKALGIPPHPPGDRPAPEQAPNS